ncbi:uncharacterized protein N7459_009070 [Penicillium hispanicum]|uniref:uncharacterized protein n=1 Tax=Penicillium hispanicum TaxID=1080232 RepID=UPI00253FA1D1|nr:uncharacterized protein N7459_009070 [Penicillium hispanicum]KAJ5569640.1 hypothetical protein N7459_009070 [Penicillium hispanicum]
MAVGPTLGTGVFIGAGQALAIGGPASLLISYLFLSLLTYFMATTIAEVAAYTPSRHGTMVTNGFRYMTTSMGFAAACLRWYAMAMFVPYEISTAMVNLGLWNPGSAIGIRLVIITSIIVGFNYLPEKLFKSSEVIFTRVKIGTLVCLLVLSLSIGMGGATGHDHWGFQYWKSPGAMHEYLTRGSLGRFWGLLQCLLHSSIAFTFAPELIVHRAELSETADQTETTDNIEPTGNSKIPNNVFADVGTTAFPYILSSVAMGVMAPYNEPLLTNNGAGSGLSPFVVGINTAKIRILPVTATIAIFISSVASGRSFLYLASRVLCAMAEVGHAPRILKNRNTWGVPWVAVTATATFALLAFLSVGTSSSVVTNYFILFVNSSGYLSWLISCVVLRRFRQQLKLNHADNSGSFKIQPLGAYLGFVLSVVLLLANGLSSAVPGNQTGPRAARIFFAYISIPLFLVTYLVHRLRNSGPRQSHRGEGSLKETCRDPAIRYHPGWVQPSQGTDPPSPIELEQVWIMARES